MNDSSVTRSLSVAQQLRAQLLQGDFEPDSRLQEIPLSESLGVSRTPIREALRQLAQEGLLIYEPNRGYRVRRFTLDDMMKAFRLRMALEGLAARLCAERAPLPEMEKALRDVLAKGDALLATGNTPERDEWRAMNRELHGVVHHYADNPLLEQAEENASRIPIVNSGTFRWYDVSDYRRSHDQHHRIVDAICQRQPDRADFLMQEHIYQAAEVLRKNLS